MAPVVSQQHPHGEQSDTVGMIETHLYLGIFVQCKSTLHPPRRCWAKCEGPECSSVGPFEWLWVLIILLLEWLGEVSEFPRLVHGSLSFLLHVVSYFSMRQNVTHNKYFTVKAYTTYLWSTPLSFMK